MADKNLISLARQHAAGRKQHWVVPGLMILILLGGYGWMRQSVRQANDMLRMNLLDHATSVARTINRDRLSTLSFTAEDVNRPEFKRLCSQMRAYAETTGLRSLYTMALRDGKIVFGPESLPPDDPYASPPGTVYEQPAPQDFEIFKSGKTSVQGLRTDEYGTFIFALAPVLDPRTGEVLLVVGIDLEVTAWRAALREARQAPILFTVGLLAILLTGSLLIKNCYRTNKSLRSWRYKEALMTAAVMLMLTLASAWFAHDAEYKTRHATFTTLARAQASGIREELTDLRSWIKSMKLFFESSVYIDRSEFGNYAKGFPDKGFAESWRWIPAVPPPDKALFEVAARREGLADFSIWQQNGKGEREPAAGRKVFYPVLYIEPLAGRENLLGYDLGSVPFQCAAIEETLRTGLPVISVQETSTALTNKPSELLVVQSVQTATQKGVVAAAIRPDRLLWTQVYKSGTLSAGLSAGLFQLEGGKPPLFLAGTSDKCSQVCWEGHAGLSLAEPVFIFGRSYILLIHPEPVWLATHPLRNGGRVGASGLMLTALLTAFVAFLANRPAQLEREVRLRIMELHESEENLRITLNSIGDAVISIDLNGRIVRLNPVAEALTGWSQYEAGGQPLDKVFRIINEQTREPVENPVHKVLAAGKIVALANHTLLIAKDGCEIPIADSGAPIKDAAGKITGVVLVFRDQTKEKDAQKTLRESEASLREAQHIARTYSWFHDMKTGERGWSDEAFRIYGVEKQAITKEFIFSIIHPDDLHILEEAGRAASCGQASTEMEIRFVRPDGQVGWLLNRWQSTYDQSGKEIKRTGITQDITEHKRTEEILRHITDVQNLILNNSTLGIALIRDRVFQWVNPRLSELLQLPVEQLRGVSTRVMYPSEEQFEELGRMTYPELIATGCFDNTFQLKRGDGSLFWCRCIGKVLNQEKPNEASLWMFEDVTERKQHAAERERATQFLQAVIDCIPEAIMVINRDYTIALSNRMAREQTGVLDMAAKGLTCYQISHGQQTPCECDLAHPCPRQRVLETGKPVTVEHIHRDAQGRDLHVEIIMAPVFDDCGEIVQFIESSRDITKRKQAETELLRLSAAIKQTAEAVVITNVQGIIEYVNPAFESITGYLKEEAIGQNPHVLKSGKHAEAFYKNLWQTISSGRTWEGRLINKRKDGTLYTEEASISPVCAPNGTIINYVAIKRDITEEISKEEKYLQTQKMEAVGRLAGGVAHDFNNMLQVIIGFSEILLGKLRAETPEHQNVAEINKAATRAAEMTRQLLTFSRKNPVQFVRLNLNDPVYSTEIMLRQLFDEKIELVLALDPALKSVKADAGQMERALLNLAINARDAMPKGGQLTISTENAGFVAQDSARPETKKRECVCLSVSDTGTGISRDVQNHLFEPFYTTKAQGKGTGLGLAVIYGIVQQHNGWINVDSKEGLGTTFKIYLPVYADTSGEMPAVAPPPETPAGKGENILLVEDDPAIREFCLHCFHKAGYLVRAAATFNDACDLFTLEQGGFDLLFSDIILPGQNGIKLADELRKKEPGLPVVLSSGSNAAIEHLSEVSGKGYLFIQKPFTVTVLLQTVRKALKEKVK